MKLLGRCVNCDWCLTHAPVKPSPPAPPCVYAAPAAVTAGIKSDKLKEEKAAAAGKKTTKAKATLNVGRGGGAAGARCCGDDGAEK